MTHLSAIRLAANMGRVHDVKWLCDNIPEEQRYEKLKDSFASACGRVVGPEQAQEFSALGGVRMMLYSGDVEEVMATAGACGLRFLGRVVCAARNDAFCPRNAARRF